MEELKTYTTELTIDARTPEEAEKILEKMYRALSPRECDNVMDSGLKDLYERHYVERIHYEKDWNGEGEHFLFQGKWSDEDSDQWGLDTAYKLFDLTTPDGEKYPGELISYQALTKIRELQKMRVEFYFG